MKLDQNTVCLVTGGASGLGLATVLAFLAKGCKVVIADFNQEAGNQILQEQNTPNLKFFKTDVSNEENVIQLIKYTVNEFGAIHIVVNSAGVISAGYLVTPKGTIPVDEMMRVLKINVVGTFNIVLFLFIDNFKIKLTNLKNKYNFNQFQIQIQMINTIKNDEEFTLIFMCLLKLSHQVGVIIRIQSCFVFTNFSNTLYSPKRSIFNKSKASLNQWIFELIQRQKMLEVDNMWRFQKQQNKVKFTDQHYGTLK